jgi:hypothetical protein
MTDKRHPLPHTFGFDRLASRYEEETCRLERALASHCATLRSHRFALKERVEFARQPHTGKLAQALRDVSWRMPDLHGARLGELRATRGVESVAARLAGWLDPYGTPDVMGVTGIVRADPQASPVAPAQARFAMKRIVGFGQAVVDAREPLDLDFAGDHLIDAAREIGTEAVVDVLIGRATVQVSHGAAATPEPERAPAKPVRPAASSRAAAVPVPAALTKAQRWAERKQRVAAGRTAPSARANAAAQRLAINNVAVEKARLADHIYHPTRAVPQGWRNASRDAGVLKQYGLAPRNLQITNTNFRAQLYTSDPAVFGEDVKPTLVFKGTDMTSLDDWSNNFLQGLNKDSAYYRRAVEIGKKLGSTVSPVDIAGHSLGGGLCSAASVASGKDCWSFNAAGLRPETVARYGGTPQPSKVYAYHVDGEILTTVQHLMPLPEAIGAPYPLPGNGMPLSRHAIEEVIAGIEKQKEEDMAILQELAP